MRVICIDAAIRVQECQLKEGEIYTVEPASCECCYWVLETKSAYHKNRFIPLSTINELELVNLKEEVI